MPIVVNPHVTQREAVCYAAARRKVSMKELRKGVIPDALQLVESALAEQGIEPNGPPLIRYVVIDMPETLEVEIGWPVPDHEGLGRSAEVSLGQLPSAEYAVLTFEGVEDGVAANRALLEWGEERGVVWDSEPTASGERFAARVEHLLSGPADDPDPATWRVELAIALASHEPE